MVQQALARAIPPVRDADIPPLNIYLAPRRMAAHGVLRLVLEMDGEAVERRDAHIGLLNRGSTKLIEYESTLARCF